MEIKLTGKCKKDFKKWFIKTIAYTPLYSSHIWNNHHPQEVDVEDVWDNLPQSMQYGVYVDFFDSVELYTSEEVNYEASYGVEITRFEFKGFEIEINYKGFTERIKGDTRTEARQKAIEKANELYNEKHK